MTPPGTAPDPRPRGRDLWGIAALAVALRLGLVLCVLYGAHQSFHAYANSSDGPQYLARARAWLGDRTAVERHPDDRGLCPGYPALMAGLHLAGVPLDLASLLPSWLAVGAVAAGCALYFRDRRIGWAMAALTPTYILNASLISTEALGLLLVLAALWRARRDDAGGTGLLLGLAALFGPAALFPFLGVLAFLAYRKRWRSALTVTILAGLVVALGLAAVWWRFGTLGSVWGSADPHAGPRFTWPFHALFTTPSYNPGTPATPFKIGYVWLHVVVVLIGCLLLFVRWRAQTERVARALPALLAVWLIGNTAYVLCLSGPAGFHEFPRLVLPALPPLFWAYREVLPRRAWAWPAIGALSLTLAYTPAKARLAPATAAPAQAAAAVPYHPSLICNLKSQI
jgi:hypothetical protein